MRGLLRLLKDESKYVLLALFIVIVNIIVFASKQQEVSTAKSGVIASQPEETSMNERENAEAMKRRLEGVIRKKVHLRVIVHATILLALLVISLGFLIDFLFLAARFEHAGVFIPHEGAPMVRWSLRDVARMVILFMFFGYVVMIIESSMLEVFPLLKNTHFRMILNSSVMDILALACIVNFALAQYKSNIASLGLSLKHFVRNVLFGIGGYIAAVPLFLLSLAFVFIIVKLIHYSPERQQVVELFLKEKNSTFLIYSGIFASIFGPFAEEIFFRGFLYGAVKKKIGILWATMATSGFFAALHANVVGFLPIMVLSILLTVIYEKTGTLAASITAHITHNLVMLYLVFVARQLGVF